MESAGWNHLLVHVITTPMTVAMLFAWAERKQHDYYEQKVLNISLPALAPAVKTLQTAVRSQMEFWSDWSIGTQPEWLETVARRTNVQVSLQDKSQQRCFTISPPIAISCA
eukprot:5101161-Amphidinium_carterae.1